jgi:hypothetical protein
VRNVQKHAFLSSRGGYSSEVVVTEFNASSREVSITSSVSHKQRSLIVWLSGRGWHMTLSEEVSCCKIETGEGFTPFCGVPMIRLHSFCQRVRGGV